jgi:hypothetical protein
MNFYWLAVLGLYLAIGVFVCSFARDKNDKPMPIHHFILIVWVWPALFLLGRDG